MNGNTTKQAIYTNEYDALIKKIRRKRKIVIAVTIVAVLIVLIACSPIQMVILDETIIDYKGMNPVFATSFILFIFFWEAVAYAIVSNPLVTSMDAECDPQKHLILNAALNAKNMDRICGVDYFYLGDFNSALNYATQMIARNKPSFVPIGLFLKARCEFFMGDFDSLKGTVKQYEASVLNLKKMSRKTREVYRKIQKSLDLTVAIADNDREKIKSYRNVEVWNGAKATQGYINYMKGLAAYSLGEKQETIYYLMAVKETCGKTVLAKMAEQYLSDLNETMSFCSDKTEIARM